MSRLINPGAGDVCDRLTILALKIKHNTDLDRPVEHFERERGQLLPMIAARAMTGIVLEHLLELAAVNAFLWHNEDALRASREAHAGGPPGWTFERAVVIAELGMRTQELNDRRAQLVTMINCNVGDDRGDEKLR